MEESTSNKLHNMWSKNIYLSPLAVEGRGRITSISATNHIGHNHIGHIEDHIGHRQSRYRPQVDIGHTISATNV